MGGDEKGLRADNNVTLHDYGAIMSNEALGGNDEQSDNLI